MASKPPDAFLSYTRSDDQHDGGAISEFRTRLASAVRAVTGEPFEIFQDIDGIGLGQHWPSELDQLLDEARFFIPILTPSYFSSQACRDELGKFLKAEKDRGRNDLVLPIYYIRCRVLEDPSLRECDALAATLHQRQREDWRDRRFKSFADPEVRRSLELLAERIDDARKRIAEAVGAEEGAHRSKEEVEGARRAELNEAIRRLGAQQLRRADKAEAKHAGPHAADQAAALEIGGVAAKFDDPSIWATATDTLEHHDAFRRGMTSVALPSCARGYIRIIPAGWKKRIPAVSVIANMRAEEAVQPVATREGDFGACEEGYVRYWLTGMASDDKFETRNVAMWFDETGEFWVLDGTSIDEGKQGHKFLNVRTLIHGWHDTLGRAMAIYDRLGAYSARKVEAGLVGVRDARWPARFAFDSIPARKGRCVLRRERGDWNQDAQLEFLTDAYSEVKNLFGLPPADQEEVRKLLQ